MEVLIMGLSFFALGGVSVSLIILGIYNFLKSKTFLNFLLLLFMIINGTGVVVFPALLCFGKGIRPGFVCAFLFFIFFAGMIFLSVIRQKK